MSAQRQQNSLIERLLLHSKTNPTHDAIISPRFTLSYAELLQLVQAQVNAFDELKISSNSVIGIKCAEDTQHLVSSLAAIHIGATSCTIATHETDLAQEAMISRCGVTHVVDESVAIDPMSLDNSIQFASLTHMTEARILFSTSGTTGEPKLVIHHDSDIVQQAHRHISSEQERFTCLASMQHNFAKRHRLYCVAAGATNIFLDDEQQSLVAQCQTLNVNVLHVSAFQAQELLATPNIDTLPNIRLKLGGSHVPLLLRSKLRNNITSNLQAGYGTTETGAIAFTDPNDSNAGESVGQPLLGIEVRTVTPNREPLDAGERGEIAIRCNGMFRGYLGRPDLTSTRLKNGWFYTGDIGYLDKQQRIHLCGRSDDMFVFNSMNIYPQDIESQICQYPDVIDAAVLAKASSIHGNIPVALIVFDKNVKPSIPSLKKFVQDRVGLRCPRQFTIVEKIPRNAAGKISRSEAMSLTINGKQIRRSIIQALTDAHAIGKLEPSLTSKFENNDKDITLRELGMDSLARMELLIVLETDYDTIIMPDKFSRFRSLGDFVSHVLKVSSRNKLDQDHNTKASDSSPSTSTLTKTDIPPYIVRFFHRVFNYCHTVAQLNKALTTLEQRLTPTDFICLHDWNLSDQLIPSSATVKFQTALNHWFKNMNRMMLDSGKPQPESFVSRKLASSVTYFVGPGSPTNKTLLVCFSARGSHRLMIPNTILSQHSDASQHDLLIISEPLGASYRLGVPPLGNNVIAVINWLARSDIVKSYNCIRTFGCSAGGYPAVIAGYLLNAEMAFSVGGRFPTERHPLRILNMLLATWRAKRKGHCSRILMSYDTAKTRDRNYAKIIAKLCTGSLLAVEFSNKQVGHKILRRLAERGELAPYLSSTIFAEKSDELINTERANMIISFPSTQIQRLTKN